MNDQTLQDVGLRSTEALERRAATMMEALSARRAVENELEEMKGSGRILLMSDEEERLIRSFRRFKGQLKRDGEVFKWQTRRDAFEEGRLIEAPESVLVRDPQEVSD